MRARDRLLIASTTVSLRNARFRFGLFFVRMWLLKALARTILPVPVFLNRLAAARFVLILGIANILHSKNTIQWRVHLKDQ